MRTGRQRDRIAQLFGIVQIIKRIYFTELGISIKELSSLVLPLPLSVSRSLMWGCHRGLF